MSHEMAKKPKKTLAPSSFSEYLKTLAASMKTSLASWSARITDPIWKNLQNWVQESWFKILSIIIISVHIHHKKCWETKNSQAISGYTHHQKKKQKKSPEEALKQNIDPWIHKYKVMQICA